MPKSDTPMTIESGNLSLAWAQVVDRLARPGVTSISPLTLSITGFGSTGEPIESTAIREAVDALMVAEKLREVENVAFTIFPKRYHQLAGGDRAAFYAMFLEAFERIKVFNASNNKKGLYFQRLIDFNGGGQGPNQLEWILKEYEARPGTRRSKWQATTFDPMRDVNSEPYQEFPCMQQVSFTFDGSGGLVMNAFYATQQIIHKGYGNYLGLCRLAAFMAHEMGLKLVRVNVFVGVAKMDKLPKAKSNPHLLALLSVLAEELKATSESRQAA
jgi:hypothetical protein